ncbi:MAG: four-carbon acid sugar kinase family protein [Deltaproteobacteria bacterium]|nr:four-carbon acid sugar kinase family protein [Deltaproteobacteria bacterium]
MRPSHSDKRIGVIADDLTGANDTGVQFAKQGLTTLVLMGTHLTPGGLEEDVVVVDCRSRALAPEEAYRKAAQAALLFKDSRFRFIFKKIDSTLRGNIGREIDAVMDTCGQELAIVAPAYPRNGRTTIGGYHLLHGIPLEDTEIARDPRCPIRESHIPTLLSGQTPRKVGHVGIKAVAAGQEAILEAMRERIAAGEQVLLCDIWQDEHLKMLAAAGMRLGKPLLWVGSAGLAEHLPPLLGPVEPPDGKDPAGARLSEGKAVVVLAGSVSPVTRSQVGMLIQRADVEWIEMDPCTLLQPEAATHEISRCLDAALDAVKSGRNVVMTTGYGGDAVDKVRKEAFALGLPVQETAERIADALGDLGRRIAAGETLAGLVLTGGDIAASACSLLSATGIRIIEEIAPGIPLGMLKGGPFDGLKVVTKAGAFGAEDALCKAVARLKRTP